MIRFDSNLTEQDIRKILANIGFTEESDITKKAGNLSGGELAKLTFAMVTYGNIDLLIIDEPTNNLDLNTKESIAKIISKFSGTIVIVSHDRDFLNSININNRYEIRNKELNLV